MSLKTITLQFKKPINVTKEQLNAILVTKYHDIEYTKIDAEPNEDVIKTLSLYCNRCSPQGVLNFLRSLDSKNVDDLLKGLEMSEPEMEELPNENQDESVDINKTCNDLGKAFTDSFQKVANLAQTLQHLQAQIDSQNEQIAQLNELLNGREATDEQEGTFGLLNAIESIREEAKNEVQNASLQMQTVVDTQVQIISEKSERIDRIENSCKAIENHLANLPLFERVLTSDDNEGNES